ncbi:ABC transporter ATP-binding protein [Actinosynnema sp. ALI-1.44]|uniref:ABC transporter ATP-binding protein n=1 Tax=Actinosynnema sp. ALI-1.44 TaxID=1933779 RepID=UPI00097C9610|nr:ATP-binding cassette domain-containing protein [Actinosynnema sp. ALI-1.44]ONI90373.1 ABC transporter ATP-binding protein [Actinosynnema sp. ALI-1.44]
MLRLEDVTIERAGVPVIRSVSMDVAAGQVTVLLGVTGAGKTSLLEGISGVVPIRSGAIVLDGTRIERVRAWRRTRLGVARVEPTRKVFRGLTVAENLRVACKDLAALDEVFELFPELREREHKYAGLLSRGEQQMLVISRALLGRPKVLLIDEMSFGLAPVLLYRLADAVRALADRGAGVLLAERCATPALSIADRAYVLARGELVLDGGSADELGEEERLHGFCLGELGSLR